MSNLRNKLIRLAYTKPELRKDLLPLLKNKEASRAVQDLMKQQKGFFEGIVTQLRRNFRMYNDKPEKIVKSIAEMMVEGGPRKLSPISISYFIDYDDYGMDPSDPSYDLAGSRNNIKKQHERKKKDFVKEVTQIARKYKMDFSFSIEPSKGSWGDEIDFGVGVGDDEAWGYIKLHVKFSGKQISVKK